MRYHKGSIYGGDTMKLYELANLMYHTDKKGAPKIDNPQLAEMVAFGKFKARKKFNRKNKEPKGKAENGSYCPKEKVGQSWSYTKDRVEVENNGEDVA